MRHRGTKDSKPTAQHGYGWYDPDTGAIDRSLLAAEATRSEVVYEVPPSWLLQADIPARLPGATPVDLARLEARARRAFVHHES